MALKIKSMETFATDFQTQNACVRVYFMLCVSLGVNILHDTDFLNGVYSEDNG